MKASQFAASHPYVFQDTQRVSDSYKSEWLTLDEANKYAVRAQDAGLITTIAGRRWEDDKYQILIYDNGGKSFVYGEKFTGPIMAKVSDTPIPPDRSYVDAMMEYIPGNTPGSLHGLPRTPSLQVMPGGSIHMLVPDGVHITNVTPQGITYRYTTVGDLDELELKQGVVTLSVDWQERLAKLDDFVAKWKDDHDEA